MRRRTALAAAVLAWACAMQPGPAGATVNLSVEPLVLVFHAASGNDVSTKVVVSNAGDEPERVTVQQTDWHTAVDGSVRIERPGTEGASSLNPYLSLSSFGFVLAGGESRTLTVTLRLPATFPGTPASYWGGFVLRGAPLRRGGVGPAALVIAYDTIGEPRRHVRVDTVRVAPDEAGGVRVFARFRNDGADYVRPSARIMVSQSGRVVRDETIAIRTIFAGDTRIVQHGMRDLAPGAYRLELVLDDGGPTLTSAATAFEVP
ncbi:MAG: hypothetical protein JO103_10900 [Candidatus Eremiobacteraeota bacterium]|nr:hypothetical protein [Candidatus Eremiobacteraeota bacterium]